MTPTTPSEKADVLAKASLFKGLSAEQTNEIARHAEVKSVTNGTMIGQHGQPGSEFAVILSGDVQVMRYGKDLRTLGEGDSFGEISLIDGGPRTATLVAKSDVSLLAIPHETFSQLLDTVPGLQRNLLNTLCQNLRDAQSSRF